MPLVLDPRTLPPEVLNELAASLKSDLAETEELVLHPRGRVLDPASLETARELLLAVRAELDRPGDRTPDEVARDANVAYATMLAVIDLVKSHTEVPRVPAPRKTDPGG